jgi:hypothetical protein
MMMTMDIPEDLVRRLSPVKAQLPHILELGLREYHTESPLEFQGISEILDFLAGVPAPEEILQLRPTSHLQARMRELLNKNRESGLTDTEEREWARYEYLEHLVRLAKANAQLKLQTRGNA